MPRAGTIWVVDDSELEAKRAASGLLGLVTHGVETFADGEAMLERLMAALASVSGDSGANSKSSSSSSSSSSSEGPTAVPVAIVLDWVMPGLSGPEIVRFVRAREAPLNHIPILLLTSEGGTAQVVEGLAAGANDFVRKPYELVELRARVDALLRSAALLDRATRAEQALRAMLVNAPDPLITIDDHGNVAFVNALAAELWPHDVVGRPLHDLVPTLDVRGVRTSMGAMPTPKNERADVIIGMRTFSPTVRRLPFDENGARTSISLRDVTERRLADERKLDFYSVVAHDLRTPLSAMLLRTDMLLRGKRGAVDARANDEMRRLERSIHGMIELINDFLSLARLDASDRDGSGPHAVAPAVDLIACIRGATEELRPLAEAKELSLDVDTAGAPARAIVGATDRRLNQVLTNLVGNAIKFTPPRGAIRVRVEVSERERDAQGRSVRVSVEDNGPGIAPDQLPHLFSRFARGEERGAGTGLGLMIVKEIVERAGGEVGASARQGGGSTFWFRLPLVL